MSDFRSLFRGRRIERQVEPEGRGVAMVSANFGGIDGVKELPRRRIDAYYYTDELTRDKADPQSIASWSEVIVPDYPRFDFGPRLRARYFKHQIHRLDEVQDRRWLVWADSSVEFHDLEFVNEAVERLSARPERDRILVIPHPDRATVREEYEFIRDEVASGNEYLRIRYENEKLAEQMAYFKAQGWDLDAPLWCGTFWIVENSTFFKRLWDDWWDQNLRYGLMDQLSLPVLLSAQGVIPERLEVVLWSNEYFHKAQHQKLM